MGLRKLIFTSKTKNHSDTTRDFSKEDAALMDVINKFQKAGTEIGGEAPFRVHHKEICNIDPYSPFLTSKEKDMILEECQCNIWYYLRRVARVQIQATGQAVPFEFTTMSVATTMAFSKCANIWLTGKRQHGVTTTLLAILIWELLFGKESSATWLCAEPISPPKQCLCDMIESLPLYFKIAVKTSGWNSINITIAAPRYKTCDVIFYRNVISDIDRANAIIRACTNPILVIDDASEQVRLSSQINCMPITRRILLVGSCTESGSGFRYIDDGEKRRRLHDCWKEWGDPESHKYSDTSINAGDFVWLNYGFTDAEIMSEYIKYAENRLKLYKGESSEFADHFPPENLQQDQS